MASNVAIIIVFVVAGLGYFWYTQGTISTMAILILGAALIVVIGIAKMQGGRHKRYRQRFGPRFGPQFGRKRF